MSYTCQYLQFGDNEKEVPGFNELTLSSEEETPPVYKILIDQTTKELWNLAFSFRIDSTGPKFIPASQEVTGGDNVIIKSWYIKQGINGQNHYFTVMPFVASNTDARFLNNELITKFSEPGAEGNTICTDTIQNKTVKAELPQKIGITKLRMRSVNDGIYIEITSTDLNEIELLMPGEGTSVLNNTITVRKNQSCLALVIFLEVTSENFKKIQTLPNREIIPQIGIEILEELAIRDARRTTSDLSFNLSTRKDPTTIRTTIDSVLKKIHEPVLS